MGLACRKEKCSRIGFLGTNLVFSLLGAALLIASCIVRYDQSMVDKYLDYSSFQNALESANVSVHTPSSLNIGEIFDVVCTAFIIIGVLFLLLGILGIIGVFMRLKSLLITYAVMLLVLVILEIIVVVLVATLRGKMEGWIKDALKDSIRNNYSGINGSDVDTLRWNFIMHSFQCCGVDRYSDFRELPARNWDIEIKFNNIVTGKQIPFACCNVKNDTFCVIRPNSTTAFIEKGCYQVMRNWVAKNTSVLVGVGICVWIIELILVVLAFVFICCKLRKGTYEQAEDLAPIQPYKLPHAHLVTRNQNLFHRSDVISNPAYVDPVWHDSSVEIFPLRQWRELYSKHPSDNYDQVTHDMDTFKGSLSQNESYGETFRGEPPKTSFASQRSSQVLGAKAWKRNLRNEFPERTAANRSSGHFGAPPSEYC
ncbi:hypothetical protein ACJMK2_026953 [Sinanodonta woodiana]|uniref:Tetraspanin n=1 Tax=Sinanodonta woodiana TaxID=1069815 RepID=A0ABD3XL77_SINWO